MTPFMFIPVKALEDKYYKDGIYCSSILVDTSLLDVGYVLHRCIKYRSVNLAISPHRDMMDGWGGRYKGILICCNGDLKFKGFFVRDLSVYYEPYRIGIFRTDNVITRFDFLYPNSNSSAVLNEYDYECICSLDYSVGNKETYDSTSLDLFLETYGV